MGCDGPGGGGGNPLMQRRSSILVRFAVTDESQIPASSYSRIKHREYCLTSMAALLSFSFPCMRHTSQSRIDGSAVIVGLGARLL